MIFVMVGTEKFPFDRLFKAIDNGIKTGRIKQKVFAQTGPSAYIPLSFDYTTELLPFDELVEFIQRSDIVVAHAGVGSTLLCLSMGKIPILFPRYGRLGEHFDDHQVELARQMERESKVLCAYNEEDLLYKISSYKDLASQLKKSDSGSNSNKKDLIDYLRKIIA